MFKPVSEKDKFRRSTQPIIFKLGWLQISHNHPNEYGDGKGVVNVYWAYRFLFCIHEGHVNISVANKPFLRRFSKNKTVLSIPPYR